MNRLVLILFFTLAVISCCFADNDSSSSKEEQHIEVSMRMIGHQVLLSLGDSTSRVLPIEKKGEDEYKIRFENEFAFNPESVASVIDSVIAATKIASNYIVEFEACETDQVVHSYEIGRTVNDNVLACGTRDQPRGWRRVVTGFSHITTMCIANSFCVFPQCILIHVAQVSCCNRSDQSRVIQNTVYH